MNRIIEFRAWDKKIKKFYYMDFGEKPRPIAEAFEPIVITLDGLIFDRLDQESLLENSSRFILQQFTGVKDINRKKIYEGDLVKGDLTEEEKLLRKIFNERKQDLNYTHGEIRFYGQAWKITQTGIGTNELSEFVCCWEHPASLKVIGNIFENPELL